MKVVGKQMYDTTYEGKPYSGIRFFVTGDREGVEGTFTDVVKISSTKPRFDEICAIPVGSEIVPIYNRYGKIEDVNVVNVKK